MCSAFVRRSDPGGRNADLSGSVLPVKVKEGAPADLIVTTPEFIDDLVKAGKVVAGSRVDFVRSSAGVAVRAGRSRILEIRRAERPEDGPRPRARLIPCGLLIA
jgi:hypothetical protein